MRPARAPSASHLAMGLTGALLFVQDLERMTAFYGDALGLVPIAPTRLDNWVEFTGGQATFALHAIPPEAAADIATASPPRRREESPAKLQFEVDSLARTRQRIEALGGSVIERPWGGIDFVDPEGNIGTLSERRTTRIQGFLPAGERKRRTP